MPLKLSHVVQNRAARVITFTDGSELNVEFYPAKLTAEMTVAYSNVSEALQTMTAASAEQAVALLKSPIEMLLTLLASWDFVVTDPESGEERPAPIDRPTLESLGLLIQWTILIGIMHAQSGQDAGGKLAASAVSVSAPASDATSLPTAH